MKHSSEKDIKEKVEKARKACVTWKNTPLQKRLKLLQGVRDTFSKHTDELAKLITQEMRKPITQSKSEVQNGLSYFQWYLDNAEKILAPEKTYENEESIHIIYRDPIGVAAVICPWNYPFSIFLWGVMSNLIVGNTVVFKISEECQLLGEKLEKLMQGLPDGVFNEIYGGGKEGEYLAHQNIDLIHFTGSSEVGKKLYKLAGQKFIRAVMELGGSAPGIVFEDANIDATVDAIYENRFLNCGQACDALKRLIVHESRFEEIKEKLKKLVQKKKIGMPEDTKTEIGPLVNERQLKRVEAQVADAMKKGAKIIVGGRRHGALKGAYYEPTLLTNITPNMRVWKEEVFGPVLPMTTFATEKEAITLANDTQYGLGSYIFTNDKERAKRVAAQIEAGSVGINNKSYWMPENPFGGYKISGMGREHGKYGFHEITQVKVVAIEK